MKRWLLVEQAVIRQERGETARPARIAPPVYSTSHVSPWGGLSLDGRPRAGQAMTCRMVQGMLSRYQAVAPVQ